MPKKQPRNAFYFFMVDFKEEQRKKGVNYANMAEVSQAAGPLWPNAAPAVRAKFEAMAKAEKAKANVPERKFTSTGVSLADLEAAERERREAVEAERRDIINFVKQKSVNESILDEDIFLMDVNSYCKAGASWLIGEFTLLRFTLRHGVKDSYHELINPGGIPIGYAFDVKNGCKELGLAMPDETSRRTDYIQILANVVDYLRRRDGAPAGGGRREPPPPVYTLPEKVPQVLDFITQLCNRAAQYDTPFRVYQLDSLFYQLVAHIPSRRDEGFPKESLALTQLKRDPFKYSPGLACELHVEADKSVECSSSRVTRWAFTVLDMTCALLDLPAHVGRHVPADYHLDAIIAHKEEKRALRGAGAGHMSPDDTPLTHPSADESYECERDVSRNTSTSTSTSAAEKKRTHVPLRMPKTDYSMSVRAPPEITLQDEFPPLPRRGRGRGLPGAGGVAGVGGSFDRMKL